MDKKNAIDKRNMMDKKNTIEKKNVVEQRNVVNRSNEMDKRNLAFGPTNFVLLAISAVIVVIGFILMSGPGSTAESFNNGIFSPMRIEVAPVVCFLGFILMIVAVIYRPNTKSDGLVEKFDTNSDKEFVESQGWVDRLLAIFIMIGGAILVALGTGILGHMKIMAQILLIFLGCVVIAYGVVRFKNN